MPGKNFKHDLDNLEAQLQKMIKRYVKSPGDKNGVKKTQSAVMSIEALLLSGLNVKGGMVRDILTCIRCRQLVVDISQNQDPIQNEDSLKLLEPQAIKITHEAYAKFKRMDKYLAEAEKKKNYGQFTRTMCQECSLIQDRLALEKKTRRINQRNN